MKKTCSKCGVEKELSEFYKQSKGKYGVRNICKLCIKEYNKEYKTENSDKIKEYYQENADKIKEYYKEYKTENADNIKEYKKEYKKEKYHSDSQYRLKDNIRSNLHQAFKLYSKNGKTKACADYGIDFKAIFNHVGPNPEGDYHLDHIIPVSVFNYDVPEHVRLAHLPQNLRWLDATKNLSKNDTLDWELINNCDVLKEIAKQIGITNEPN